MIARVLKLIRKWLKAGVMKEGQFYETDLGSPQGGVISPLLANHVPQLSGHDLGKEICPSWHIVRYADDLVILCRYKRASAGGDTTYCKAVFQKLELTMNTSKSKLVNLWEGKEGFDFLGHHPSAHAALGKEGDSDLLPAELPIQKGDEEDADEGEGRTHATRTIKMVDRRLDQAYESDHPRVEELLREHGPDHGKPIPDQSGLVYPQKNKSVVEQKTQEEESQSGKCVRITSDGGSENRRNLGQTYCPR